MEEASPLVLGLDLGTTSVKAVLLRSPSGEVAQGPIWRATQAFVESPVAPELHPEDDLQDPAKVIAALRECLAELDSALLGRVVKVAVCGQMHGVVLWKQHPEEGVLLSPGWCSSLHTWQDRRCDAEFIAKLPRPDSNLRVASGYGCATLMWYSKHHPDYLSQFDRAGGITDLLTCYLTRRTDAVLMSPHNAASWGYFNVEHQTWNAELLDTAGFPMRLLPTVADVGSVVGTLKRDLCGVPRDTPVCVAMGDMQCAIHATLSARQSSSTSDGVAAVLNINTSAQLAFPRPPRFHPPAAPSHSSPLEDVPLTRGRCLAVAAALNGGNALAAFVDAVRGWMAELGVDVERDRIWKAVVDVETRYCQNTTRREGESMLISPLLNGERHCPQATASASNITARGLSLASVLRAVCEGVVDNLASMAPDAVLDEAGVDEVLVTGSCVEKHPMLRRAVMERFAGRRPRVVTEGDSCVGVALLVMNSS